MEADSSSGNRDADSERLQELSEIVVELQDAPMDVRLRRRQVDILRSMPMMDEYVEAVHTLADLVMLSDDEWKDCLNKLSASPASLESFIQTVECFSAAETDYISAEILSRHALFIKASVEAATRDADPEFANFLTEDVVSGMLQDVYAQATGLLGDSGSVWAVLRDWEQERLSALRDEARDAQLRHLHELFLQRLRVPHLDIDATASEYSTFCTHFCPDQYEDRMVEATSVIQVAKAKLSFEKRHGVTREDYEQQLSMSSSVDDQLSLFASYVAWETDPKAKRAGAKSGPVADSSLTTAVFERTVAAYARAARDAADEQAKQLFKAGEASMWNRYSNWVSDVHSPEDVLSVTRRAARACPAVPSTWSKLLLLMEQHSSTVSDIQAVFEKALALGFLTEGGSTDVMEVFVTWVSVQARLPAQADQIPEWTHPVLSTASEGFDILLKVNKTGDASLRLEKFLLEWAETQNSDILQQTISLIDKPLRSRTTSYQMIILRAGVEARRGAVDAARRIYEAAVQRSDVDWPEAVYEAFHRFEQVHGTGATIAQSQRRIEKESEKLARRREKATQSQAQAEMASQAVALPADGVVTAVVGETDELLQIESSGEVRSSHKNIENLARRDREHTTVLIGGLAKRTSRELVESFFESARCGDIREIAILSEDKWPSNAALLEFKTADAVPHALAKDRRKLDDHEVSVTMLWRSTLFVTNFPRDTDDAAIRKLFTNYGTILQTRWPSRKYANSRRFCYITMDGPSSAEAARVLDGFKPNGEGDFGMSVLISDPSVKAKRTDAQDAVLFVGGLNAKTTEQEVLDLFKGHGSVQRIKLGWDPIERVCKGFAFVTMSTEADAKRALELHGTSHKGRLLKVEPNDRNYANKKAVNDAAFKEKRARTIRLDNLPDGTQEALLQQALEKIVPVRRMELFVKSRHALAELESAADVGNLLLRPDPFVFQGATVKFSEHGRRADSGRRPVAPEGSHEATFAPSTSSLTFAPRSAKRGGKVLGKGRSRPVPDTLVTPTGSSSNPQDAFRAIVENKNKQREANLETSRAKRRHEDEPASEDVDETKKHRTS